MAGGEPSRVGCRQEIGFVGSRDFVDFASHAPVSTEARAPIINISSFPRYPRSIA